MIVRIEKVRNSEVVLIIDELGRYVGSVENLEDFLGCTRLNREPFCEDDYTYFYVMEECLKNLM